MKNELAIKLTKIALIIFMLVSFLGMIFYGDSFVDYVGYNYVDGFSVEHYMTCCGDDGGPYPASDIRTSHWYSRVGLWMLMWVLILLALIFQFGVYVLLYTKLEKIQSKFEQERLEKKRNHAKPKA